MSLVYEIFKSPEPAHLFDTRCTDASRGFGFVKKWAFVVYLIFKIPDAGLLVDTRCTDASRKSGFVKK